MKEIGKKYLPIGTVVMLSGAKKRLMITGFCALSNNDKTKIWDYTGCMYPEGVLNSKQTLLFDHAQIEKVYHLGLQEDDEEKQFKKELKKNLKTLKIEKK